MEFFCGLDVAMDETAVCVVDDHGAVHLETTAVTDPDALFAVLKPFLPRLRRVGHEAGSLSPWLHPELKKLGLPAVCLETQHVRAAMSAQRNKTDKADALDRALKVVRTRIDAFGVSEPVVQRSGSNQIVVLLPGMTDQSRAEAVVNFRLLPGDGPERVIEHVRAAIGDERVKVEPTREAREASAVSPVDSPDFERISRVVRQVFPEAIVAPTLVLGGTDARHYGEVSQDVYRFGPYRFDPSDLARAHGIDERTSVAGHADAVRFFVQLLRESAS